MAAFSDSLYWIIQYQAMARVSAWVLAVYEHIITFDREVQQIWSRKFNLASILFIINRYSFLISVQCFPVLYLFADDPKVSFSASKCTNTLTLTFRRVAMQC
ncbi:hypothetical protein C8Q75DRAFT_421111 [Abortiporus biennis]|nr:hypothetical protein C8Q75DRAFT_421111 [Abortiporus biennis]